MTKPILTLSFFILIYSLPAAHTQANLDIVACRGLEILITN